MMIMVVQDVVLNQLLKMKVKFGEVYVLLQDQVINLMDGMMKVLYIPHQQ